MTNGPDTKTKMQMPQNIYDNETFFEGYMALRAAELNANDIMIRPHMRELIGEASGLQVLDIGCGAGEMCRWLVDSGAASVTGIDLSERMLAAADEQPRERIRYIHTAAEDAQFGPNSFDLVASVLMLHYIKDIGPLLRNIHTWLRPGGRFVFSMEHPQMTAGQGILEPGWVLNDDGERIAWAVTSYSDESERVSTWFVDGVVRYHRTMATLINSLVDAGFRIERMLEPHAPEEFEKRHPRLLQERMRPAFLFVSAEVVK